MTSAPSNQNQLTVWQSLALLLFGFLALASVRYFLGAETGEACDPNDEVSCTFGHLCVDEVCAPYCESDEDCPHGVVCQTVEDVEPPSDDAEWVCDMPTELEQKIRRDLDEAFNEMGWKPRPFSEGNPAREGR